MRKFSFSQKLIIKNIIKIVVVLCIMALVAYFCLYWSTSQIISKRLWLNPPSILFAIGILTGLILGTAEISFLNKVSNWLNDRSFELKNAVRGHRGEQSVFAALDATLDPKSCKVYPNFSIPNRHFDIDAVIVSPKGIFVFEVKNISGTFAFEGEKVLKISREGNRTCYLNLTGYHNPLQEVIRHRDALAIWLNEQGVADIKPRGALLLAGGEAVIEKLEQPAVYVITNAKNLRAYIEGIPDNPHFNPELRERLDSILKAPA